MPTLEIRHCSVPDWAKKSHGHFIGMLKQQLPQTIAEELACDTNPLTIVHPDQVEIRVTEGHHDLDGGIFYRITLDMAGYEERMINLKDRLKEILRVIVSHRDDSFDFDADQEKFKVYLLAKPHPVCECFVTE